MENSHNIVITVSRQMASGGTYIAHSVARKLGFKYLDNEVLYKAAKFMGADNRDLSDREERISGFIEKIVRSFSFGSPEAAYLPPSLHPVHDIDLFDAEARIIQEVAGSCNVVVVGGAGFYVLRDHPGLVKVLIHAPLGFRVKRLMEVRNIVDKDIAIAEIEESDKRKEKFLRTITGVEWIDARNYHLCIDTSAEGFEGAIETIVKLAEKIGHNLDLKQGGQQCPRQR